MAEVDSRGVFWVIDDELFAFPFHSDYTGAGLSKSGVTYNHKRLWSEIRPARYRNAPYNYFPRGRVEFSNKGKPVIYLNPNISEDIISDIKTEFGLREEPAIRYDHSVHYRCYLDDGWEAAE